MKESKVENINDIFFLNIKIRITEMMHFLRQIKQYLGLVTIKQNKRKEIKLSWWIGKQKDGLKKEHKEFRISFQDGVGVPVHNKHIYMSGRQES